MHYLSYGGSVIAADPSVVDNVSKFATPVITFILGLVTGNWQRLARWLGRKDPLQIHIESNPEIIYANHRDWVTFPQFVPLGREALPLPPATTLEMSRWASDLGGLPAHLFELQVTLTAWADLDVVVDTLRVKARTRSIPEGVVVIKPVGGASIVPLQLDVRLSAVACSVTPRHGGSYEPTTSIAFELRGGDVQRFSLVVSEEEDVYEDVDAYEWWAMLDLLVGNKRRTVVIDNNGEPFVLVRRNRRVVVEV